MKKASLPKSFKEWIASWNWHRTKQINDLFMIITIQLIISRRTKLAVANFQKCSKNYLYMHYINSIYNNWIIFMINKIALISTVYRYLTMILFTDITHLILFIMAIKCIDCCLVISNTMTGFFSRVFEFMCKYQLY